MGGPQWTKLPALSHVQQACLCCAPRPVTVPLRTNPHPGSVEVCANCYDDFGGCPVCQPTAALPGGSSPTTDTAE